MAVSPPLTQGVDEQDHLLEVSRGLHGLTVTVREVVPTRRRLGRERLGHAERIHRRDLHRKRPPARYARGVRAPVVPFVLALLMSCSGGSSDEAPPARTAVTIASGDWTVRVDLDARDVALLAKDGTVLAHLPADGLALGTRETVDDKGNYDPWPILSPTGLSPAPEDLEWLVPERFDTISTTASALEIDVTYPKKTKARLKIAPGKSAGAFDAQLLPVQGDAPLAYVRLRSRSDAKEGFYGLGEHFDDVNNRGHLRPMQIEVDGELESSYNEVHVPIPLLVGTRGWGLFVDSLRPGAWDVATKEPDLVDALVGTGVATTDGLKFHLFGAPHPLDVTKHYYDLTGYPILPARWALGPWLWRDENTGQKQVEEDLQKARDLDVATTAWWIDRPYATGVNTFDFKASDYADPKSMIQKAHDLGFRMGLWHVPYLDEKDAGTQTLRDEANAKGYYPPQTSILFNKWGKPIDLTNKDAYAWWQGLIRKYTDPTAGFAIEGFKLDYMEDIVPGFGKGRNVWRFSDGSDERTMHAGFTLFYHRVYAETLPKDGGFLLCRHANIGDQVNASVIWPGDLDADFSKHREKITTKDGSYHAVGGLPASVIGGLSLGPSGFPFFGSDTGGYRHSPPNKEVMTRWFEQTALSSVMQVGQSSSGLPWEVDAAAGWDAEMLDWYKRYARLHLRLFPYEWTLAQQIGKTGRPIQRALGLAFPELGVHPNDEYLFGDDLLVAPVVEDGKRERAVTFPPGKWIDWWTGKRWDAGNATVPAPLDTLPLFLREGGTVPMLRPTIDAMAPTSRPELVDSYATTPGVLWARVAPAEAAATFTVFDGSKIEHQRQGAKITLKSSDGAEFKSGVVFEIVGATKPSSVREGATAYGEVTDLEKAEKGWSFVDGTLRIKAPAGTHTVDVSL